MFLDTIYPIAFSGKCYSAKPGQNFNQLLELDTSSFSFDNSEGKSTQTFYGFCMYPEKCEIC